MPEPKIIALASGNGGEGGRSPMMALIGWMGRLAARIKALEERPVASMDNAILGRVAALESRIVAVAGDGRTVTRVITHERDPDTHQITRSIVTEGGV